jgi:hypothetical protein
MCNHGSKPSDVLLNLLNYYYYIVDHIWLQYQCLVQTTLFLKGKKLYLKLSFDI